MVKSLIEIAILAVVFGSVSGSSLILKETSDQVIGRLPVVAAAQLPRLAESDETRGLPVINDRDAWPKLSDQNSLGVLVTARNAIVVDKDNGKVLFEKNADQVQPIASITKLMTALVFLDQGIDLKQTITIQAEDEVPATSTIFAVGDELPLRDLFFAMLVGSANDAARVLVRGSGLSEEEFVRQMNEKAAELGMTETRFVEPTGLNPKNVSTARELTYLFRAAAEAPLIREAIQLPVYRSQGTTKKTGFIRSTDTLLFSFLNKPPYQIVVAKTGSLDEAGYCFGTAVDEKDHGVITVVLGSLDHYSRFEDAKSLAYWALTKWEWE